MSAHEPVLFKGSEMVGLPNCAFINGAHGDLDQQKMKSVTSTEIEFTVSI